MIITIAFLFLMQLVAINWEALTNGTAGLTLPLPTWSIDVDQLAVLLRARGAARAVSC